MNDRNISGLFNVSPECVTVLPVLIIHDFIEYSRFIKNKCYSYLQFVQCVTGACHRLTKN
jgi:hypothetical protein